MNYPQAIGFLHELGMFGARLGLDVPRRLAGLAGNPHERLRFIHVAGTNGKGSTCAMLESIYRHAGLRVGLFTSPHLVAFAERIQVNRRLIAEADIVRLVGELQPLVESFPADQRPTFFEAATVMALRHFVEQQCDLVIWETGLGGRLDATNIVTPLASIITNIDFDHQQWLGDTLDKIAAEKAGIIKPGVQVITGARPGRGFEVIQETAARLNSPLMKVGQASRLSSSRPKARQFLDAKEILSGVISIGPNGTPALTLAGEHQRLNAALAVATVRALAEVIPVNEEAIRDGLTNVSWPGRMQLAKTSAGQVVLLDGAHNVASAAALRDALGKEFPGTRPTLVLGVLADKDWSVIAATLAPLAGRILLVPVNSARSLPPTQLDATCREASPAVAVEICVSLQEAFDRATSDPFLLITGSLYLVGEAIALLQLSPATSGDEQKLNEWGGTPGATR